MKLLLCLLTPFWLYAQAPDRVSDLVQSLQQLTFAGDQAAAGRLVPILVEELAKPSPNAGVGWNQVGNYHTVQGEFAEAERAYRRGIKALENSGAAGADLALLHRNLGQLYLRTGKRRGLAETLLNSALRLATQECGPDAPELAQFLYVLGAARMERGDGEGAREHFERALKLPGEGKEGNLLRGYILSNLAVLLVRDKQWDRARDTMNQVVPLLERNLAARHPDLVPVYVNMAAIYRHFEQWDRAAANLEKAWAIVTSIRPEHPLAYSILNAQAEVLKKTGRSAEAKETSRRARAILASRPNDQAGEAWIHISDLKK